MLLKFIRIIKSGIINFKRNLGISISTILVITLTLFILTGLLIISIIANSLIENLKNKIDISVYFKSDAKEEDILSLQKVIVLMPEVKNVEYLSKDQVLEQFKEKHKDNPILSQSLEELEENPLQAILNIKAKDPSLYNKIASFLAQDRYKNIIENINYFQNEMVISKLSLIVKTIQKWGIAILLILSIIIILITYNTIRLAVYSSREEIKIMRLVGASSSFIWGPFFIEGILHSFFASILTMSVFYPLMHIVSPQINTFLGGTDLFVYFQENFGYIFLIQFSVALVLSVIGSIIAMRKYLKI